MVTKDEEPGQLLQEVNDAIEDLRKWKQEQRRLDEELEKKFEEQKKVKKQEFIDETTQPEVEIKNLDNNEVRCHFAELVEVKQINRPGSFNIPEAKAITNSDLYNEGLKLNEILNEWNSSLDFLVGKTGTHEDKEWEKVKEIEKELEELEDLMNNASNLNIS